MGPSVSFAPVAVQRIIYNTPRHKVQMCAAAALNGVAADVYRVSPLQDIIISVSCDDKIN